MGTSQLILVIISLLALAHSTLLVKAELPPFNRKGFPDDFLFGASSAAFQYEGAVNKGGRGPSIWDTFVRDFPGKIADGSNADVAEDFYHRYKEDVKLMKYVGLDSFRMSISWSRVLPTGKISGGVNKEGVAFYNNVIDELLANGIIPLVTIFHWDLPQTLEDEYGGFLSRKIVKDFSDFAELCFKEFGDRVKYWATINEPYIFISSGYDLGTFAPGRCSAWMNNDCPAGNSGTEPYLVAHHMLLSHAHIVKLYRTKYQGSQKGQIGIVFPVNWAVPFSHSRRDRRARQRELDFQYGWFMDPVKFGDYPRIMRSLVGKRLPHFTVEEAKLVKGSFDYIGLNYYSASFVADSPFSNTINVSLSTDARTNVTTERDGKSIGKPTGASFFFEYPEGLKELLLYTKVKYNNPPVYVTENGMANANNLTKHEEIQDHNRVNFVRSHLMALHEAIKEGANVKGYFVWSFLDTFEWNSGYTLRFGLTYIDYKDGLKRYVKSSGLWFKKFLLK